MPSFGPQTEPADLLHSQKYRGPNESFREAMNRIAFSLQDDNAHYHRFREILMEMRFMPGGRIQMAMGSTRQSTPYNCFVSGTIEDSLVDGNGSIYARLREAAATLRLGGGIGYDFSTLRPRGDHVLKIDTQTQGPVKIMEVFNATGNIVVSAGHRFGAQMGMMRIDHPDIEEYIRVKQNTDQMRRFNLSIAVTDEFMVALREDKEFTLRWGGKPYRTVDARALWETIMRSTWDWGEPGVFFIDRVNSMNNLYYCENIATCNPCAEQPLPPFGACLLGSFNLVKYLSKNVYPMDAAVDRAPYSFDMMQFRHDIGIVVAAMDNVVDRARYPLAEQKAEAITKRRMGLGITGLANAAEACGHPYGSEGFLAFEADVLANLRDYAYMASIRRAANKEAFPLYDERYLDGNFIRSLPSAIRNDIKTYGIRNSHLTSIAPTGTISLCADNVSSSIEPVFVHQMKRMVTWPNERGTIEMDIEDYGAKFLGVRGKLAHQVTAKEHVAVLAMAQKYMDSAVSKTVNMGRGMKWDDFKEIYQIAYDSGCKSCTTFNEDGNRRALLETGASKIETDDEDEEGESCEVMADGTRSCE